MSCSEGRLGSDGYYSLYIVDPVVMPVDITIAKVIKGTSTPLTGATFTLTRVGTDCGLADRW